MKIFVAGASGAIGQPLIAELIRRGHTVTGMSRSDAGAKNLTEVGATVATADAFDESSLRDALRQSEAEVVINQLTSLPKDPYKSPRHFPAIGSCGSRAAATCYELPRQRACVDTFNS